MSMTDAKRNSVTEFWRKYFECLDRASPHPPNSRAMVMAVARKITCYGCNDGLLLWFERDSKFGISFRTSATSIEAMLRKLTDPLGLNFDKGFPKKFDGGPILIGYATVGKSTEIPIKFYRFVILVNGIPQLTESPEVLVHDDREDPSTPNMIMSLPADKVPPTSKKPN